MRIAVFSALGLTTLAACGGGGAVVSDDDLGGIILPDLGGPTLQTAGAADAVSAALSPDGTIVSFNVDGAKILLNSLENQPFTPFTQAFFESGDATTVGAIAESDDWRVGYISMSNGDIGDREGAAFAERLDVIAIPSSGEVVYAGEYLGNIANAFNVVGDASFVADFDNSTISGSIANRLAVSIEDGLVIDSFEISDVDFATSAIQEGGVFVGATTGGSVANEAEFFMPSNGQINGIFVSENASALVGIYTADFLFESGSAAEVGAFVAE